MKNSVLHFALLASIIALPTSLYAGPEITPTDISAGRPVMEKRLAPENYVGFETRRLKNAWAAWCDFEWFRKNGVRVPTEGLKDEAFATSVLDAFAYQAPHPDDSPDSFTDKKKMFYADYYGGYGTSRNKGSARAGSAGRVNEKGIGQSPLLNSDDRFHSNGAAKSIEAIDEAIWGGILDRELPHGSNRVVAVIMTGTYGKIPGKNPGDPDEIFPRAIVVREDAVRPAHFVTNIRIEEDIEAKRLLALREKFARNLPLPKGYTPINEVDRIHTGFLELVDRRADQYAAHFARRFYHGSSSPSNLEITGADLDLGDQTAQPGFSKIVRIKNESPFGEIQSQVDIFDDLLADLPKTLGPEKSKALPTGEEVRARFEARFQSSRTRELIMLAGFPSEVVEGLAKENVSDEFGRAIAELALHGNEELVWIGGAPIQNTGHYDVEKTLMSLVESANRPENELRAALAQHVSDASLRDRLAKAFLAYHTRARAFAGAAGVGKTAFHQYLVAAAAIRNAPRPSLFRGDIRWHELWKVSDAGNEHGDRRVISEYIEKAIWSNVRTFRDAGPYELVVANDVFSTQGVSIRRVFAAREGKMKTILRIEPSGNRASFFGVPLTTAELLNSKLERAGTRGVAARARKQGRAIEFEIDSNRPVRLEELRITTSRGTFAPRLEMAKNGAGFQSESLIEKVRCRHLFDRAS